MGFDNTEESETLFEMGFEHTEEKKTDVKKEKVRKPVEKEKQNKLEDYFKSQN